MAEQVKNLGSIVGPPGKKGDTGAPAGFGSVTATVDGNTGIPKVTVTASGTDTAKNFAFTFQNLKGTQGAKGDKGDTGPQGAVGPTGAQGIQGPAGAVGPAGESGVTVPANGFFALSVDADGNLYAWADDGADAPPFVYDAATGNLYYVLEAA